MTSEQSVESGERDEECEVRVWGRAQWEVSSLISSREWVVINEGWRVNTKEWEINT